MTKSVRTAIFPVAGLGTRFLPATKSVPKELLPVLDTPLIQFAIDEARDAGVEKMIFVNHPSKAAIENYVLDDANLRATLHARGKSKIARELHEAALNAEEHNVVFVEQDEPRGLGHAVLCAAEEALPGAVAVLLPDDLILAPKGCLSQMIDAYETTDAHHLLATMDVPREEVGSYGVLSIKQRQGALAYCNGLVEKPAPDLAPSTSAVVGRYVLGESIFEALRTQAPGKGNEIQLTDAIARLLEAENVAGFRFVGERFDCGSKAGMLRAKLHRAQQDPQFAEVLADYAAEAPQAIVA